MRALLVARDAAPSKILRRLESELKNSGHSVLSLLGGGKSIWVGNKALESLVVVSDIVICGMSADAKLAEQELAAALAAESSSVPYGFVADIYGCHQRPAFEGLRGKASFFFTVDHLEAAEAKNLFPQARVVATGNPVWEDYFDPPMSREAARTQLGFSQEHKVILCVGGKVGALNTLFYGGAVEAAHLLEMHAGRRWRLIFALHPGDQNAPAVYEEIASFSDVPVKIVRSGEMKTGDLISACDVLVAPTSNTGIEGACQRKPVINYFNQLYLNRMERDLGSRIWKPCQMGVSKLVSGSVDDLARAILELVVYDGFSPMLEKQTEFYPKPPERGYAVKKMQKILEEIVASRK